MTYPNNYFSLRQWTNDPDDSQLGRSLYQYGIGIRAQAGFKFPAAAAFPAIAPFDTLLLNDSSGSGWWTFIFRPDLAPATTVVGRVITLGILGLTNTQVAQAFGTAVNQVSSLASMGDPTARLNFVAGLHGAPNANAITITHVLPGITGDSDASAVTAAGFVTTGFLPGVSSTGVFAGKSRPTGFILPVDGAQLVDGETFTIEVPNNTGGVIVVTFEFDSGAGVTPPNTAVPFTALDTTAQIGASIVAAMNNPAANPAGRGPIFGALARLLTFGPTSVVYIQSNPGSIGGGLISQRLMTETVASLGFVVVGMSGGQDGSIGIPLLWGPKRGLVPNQFGFETGGEG